MSGTLPNTPGFEDFTLESNQPTIVSTSESARDQSRSSKAHQWSLRLNYPDLLESEFRPILGFAVAQRGRAESFQVVLPHMPPLGVATGTPLVNGAHAVGEAAISTNGWTVSITDIMKTGDILKFSNHTKVYIVVEDTNSDVGGVASLTIEPPLIEALAGGEGVTINDVPFTVKFSGDVQRFKTTSPRFSTYELDLIESIA